MVDPEAGPAEGGVMACASCSTAVAPDDDGEVTGGVAPIPTDVVVPIRPDTGNTGMGEVTVLPAKSDTRESWDEAATRLGLDPAEYSNKDDLMVAVEEAQGTAPDTSLNAPDPGEAPE
jgi:hypothetical protein